MADTLKKLDNKYVNINSHQVKKRFTHGVSRHFQKIYGAWLLWIHKPSKPTIDFLEMPTPMGESLCHLVRIDVN